MKKVIIAVLLVLNLAYADESPLQKGTSAKFVCELPVDKKSTDNLPKILTTTINLKNGTAAVLFDGDDLRDGGDIHWKLIQADADQTFKRVDKKNDSARTYLLLSSGLEDDYTLAITYYPYDGSSGNVDNPNHDPFVWASLTSYYGETIHSVSSSKCRMEILK